MDADSSLVTSFAQSSSYCDTASDIVNGAIGGSDMGSPDPMNIHPGNLEEPAPSRSSLSLPSHSKKGSSNSSKRRTRSPTMASLLSPDTAKRARRKSSSKPSGHISEQPLTKDQEEVVSWSLSFSRVPTNLWEEVKNGNAKDKIEALRPKVGPVLFSRADRFRKLVRILNLLGLIPTLGPFPQTEQEVRDITSLKREFRPPTWTGNRNVVVTVRLVYKYLGYTWKEFSKWSDVSFWVDELSRHDFDKAEGMSLFLNLC